MLNISKYFFILIILFFTYGHSRWVGTNLEGQNFRYWNFVEINLSNANFKKAKLERTSFKKSILINANFNKASLRNADLTGADLRGADLSGSDLNKANFENADLREANLRDADLTGVNFENADLRGADLRGTDIKNANLKRAKTKGAMLPNVKRLKKGPAIVLNLLLPFGIGSYAQGDSKAWVLTIADTLLLGSLIGFFVNVEEVLANPTRENRTLYTSLIISSGVFTVLHLTLGIVKPIIYAKKKQSNLALFPIIELEKQSIKLGITLAHIF